jgi:hypothetical protein
LVSPGASVKLCILERSTFIMVEICSAAQKETIVKDFDVVSIIAEVKQISNCSSPKLFGPNVDQPFHTEGPGE